LRGWKLEFGQRRFGFLKITAGLAYLFVLCWQKSNVLSETHLLPTAHKKICQMSVRKLSEGRREKVELVTDKTASIFLSFHIVVAGEL